MKKISDKQKLSEILRFFGIKIVDLSEKIGINQNHLYSVNQGKQDFNREIMEGIAKNCPEINLFWLITGEGSMLSGVVEQHNVNGDNLNNSTKDNGSSEVVKLLADTNASQQRTIDSQHKTIETLINIIHK